jgi:hypothetical protein
MTGTASRANIRSLAVLASTACLGAVGLAWADDAPPLPEHLSGLINDYTPASVSGGPYEMRGKWSLHVNWWSHTAEFSAAMNMETSDWGISKGIVDPNDPTTRGAHTHHITIKNAMVVKDVTACPTFNPPTSDGFVISGQVDVTGNGGVAPFQAPPNPPSSLTICILGGTQVAASNITMTFTGPATKHFGIQAIHGVVVCARSREHSSGDCSAGR